MADRTLTINHADGGSETYTLKTEDVLGVRNMSVDGETVTIDRTAPDLVRTIIADGQTITIDTTREGVRTLTVDGTEITLDRTEEANLQSFLQEFTGASAAYSLRDLASSGNTTVVRVRRSSDNAEADFKASEVSDGTLVAWVGASNDGFVETWYDQSGNGNDATQSVAVSQPQIVSSGSFITRGGASKPSILLGGALDGRLDVVGRPIATSVFSALQASNTNFETLICDTTDNTPRLTTNNNANNRAYKLVGFGTPSVNVDGVTYDGTSNVSSLGFHLLGMTSGSGEAINRIGANPSTGSTGNSFDSVSELIIYDSDQSSDRSGIEVNINNQYSIY